MVPEVSGFRMYPILSQAFHSMSTSSSTETMKLLLHTSDMILQKRDGNFVSDLDSITLFNDVFLQEFVTRVDWPAEKEPEVDVYAFASRLAKKLVFVYMFANRRDFEYKHLTFDISCIKGQCKTPSLDQFILQSGVSLAANSIDPVLRDCIYAQILESFLPEINELYPTRIDSAYSCWIVIDCSSDVPELCKYDEQNVPLFWKAYHEVYADTTKPDLLIRLKRLGSSFKRFAVRYAEVLDSYQSFLYALESAVRERVCNGRNPFFVIICIPLG